MTGQPGNRGNGGPDERATRRNALRGKQGLGRPGNRGNRGTGEPDERVTGDLGCRALG